MEKKTAKKKKKKEYVSVAEAQQRRRERNEIKRKERRETFYEAYVIFLFLDFALTQISSIHFEKISKLDLCIHRIALYL